MATTETKVCCALDMTETYGSIVVYLDGELLAFGFRSFGDAKRVAARHCASKGWRMLWV